MEEANVQNGNPVTSDPTSEPITSERRLRVVLIDDDALFRDILIRNLVEERIDIIDFEDGELALKHMEDMAPCDAVLLDWRMPKLSGFDVLRQLKRRWPGLPVLIVTAFSTESNEIAALNYGAVDFVEKSRSPQIIATRLRLIIDGMRNPPIVQALPEVLQIGPLELRLKVDRCHWRGERVPLTVTEYAIVRLLASQAGEEVSYRDIYNVVHGSNFVAGDGAEGYRANVRSLIKRIRHKFRDLDSTFQEIENYAGFGYCWRRSEAAGDQAEAATSAAAPHSGLIAQFLATLGKLPMALERNAGGPIQSDAHCEDRLLARSAAGWSDSAEQASTVDEAGQDYVGTARDAEGSSGD